MRFQLRYGKKNITFALKERGFLGELKFKKLKPLGNIAAGFKKAMNSPLGSPKLSEIIRENEQVCIVVNDITRVPAARRFLPSLCAELNKLGVRNSRMFILVATGAHRRNTLRELERIVDPRIYSRIKVYSHNCSDVKNLKLVGKTSLGNAVLLNRRAVEADRVILTGEIEFHYYAGFTGGRKSVLPGIASEASIMRNHNLILSPGARKGLHPKALPGKLRGNPVHGEMVEAAAFLKPDFLINVVLDERDRIVKFFCGDFIKAHKQGCDFVRDAYSLPVEHEADLIIAGCGGFPRDINFVQAHKAIHNASFALREGGVMIVLAECSEGIGSAAHRRWFEYGSFEEIEKILRRRYSVAGQTVYSALKKASKFSIVLVSSLDRSLVRRMSMIPAEDVHEALDVAYDKLKRYPKTYVIPNGALTLPVR